MSKEEDEDIKDYLNILKALDDAINTGPWDYSLFYQTIGKKLKHLRENFIEDFSLSEAKQAESKQVLESEIKPPSGFIDVYVSLYLSGGDNITRWQSLLGNVNTQGITRPIYKNENDVKALIRSKPNKLNDAYVVVRIKETDILPVGDKPLVDRFGSELFSLRDSALQANNIMKFIHLSGTYQYVNGRLVKKAATELL